MPIIEVTGTEVEKIKGEFESYLSGLNMVGEISYSQYSKMYNVGTKLIQKSYETGLHEGQPKWHDLRKDPNDLPKKESNYIVCYIDTACERHSFELGFSNCYGDKHWIDEDAEGYDEGVIAWYEIPQFKE